MGLSNAWDGLMTSFSGLDSTEPIGQLHIEETKQTYQNRILVESSH